MVRCPRCGFGWPGVKDDPREPCQCGVVPADLAPFPWPDLVAEEWQYLTHLLSVRSQWRCEGCGQPFKPGEREVNRQHRRPRGAGGTVRADVNSLANLLLLCAGFSARLGGVLGCHGRAESEREWAEERGLVVPDGIDPALAPLTLPSGRQVTLHPTAPFYVDADGTFGPGGSFRRDTP